MVKRKLEEVISSQSVNTRFTIYIIKTSICIRRCLFFLCLTILVRKLIKLPCVYLSAINRGGHTFGRGCTIRPFD